jgi:hypothetical protein
MGLGGTGEGVELVLPAHEIGQGEVGARAGAPGAAEARGERGVVGEALEGAR